MSWFKYLCEFVILIYLTIAHAEYPCSYAWYPSGGDCNFPRIISNRNCVCNSVCGCINYRDNAIGVCHSVAKVCHIHLSSIWLTVTPSSRLPTFIVPVTWFVAVSIIETVLLPEFAMYTLVPSGVTATPAGNCPTFKVAVIVVTCCVNYRDIVAARVRYIYKWRRNCDTYQH